MSQPAGKTFTLAIAGLVVSVHCDVSELAERLAARYAGFLSSEPPHLQANIRWIGYLRQHSLLDVNLQLRGNQARFAASGYQGAIDLEQKQAWLELSTRQPIQDVDYFLRVCYALLAFDHGGLLFHAAGIRREQRGYLFFGRSGSGKTTVARLSANLSGVTILNDDLVLLRPENLDWIMYGTPFWNPTQVQPSPQQAVISGLYRLVQAKQVRIEALDPGRTLAELVANVPVISTDPKRNPILLERLQQCSQQLPVYALHFLPDASFWPVIHPEPILRSL